MRKILHILLVLLFSLTIISCGEDKEEYAENSSTTNTDNTTTTTDTTAPVIAEVTRVTTPTNDNTPNYTFSSSEAGTISYGGSCSSSTTSATSGNNTITLVSLNDGTYSDCTIGVTDSAGNVSNSLTITSFIVDTTAPTVSSISTTADNQSSVSITDNITVTFSEAMDTTYVTTNTENTSCSGTLRVSSDNFSNCVQMSSSPISSNSDKTFTVDPSDNLSYSTNYKIRVTTGVKDAAGNAMSSQYETGSAFTTSSPQWVMQAYIKAANSDAEDSFGLYGSTVNGDTIAVGAPREKSNQTTITNGTSASTNTSRSQSGAAFVYKRSGNSWTQEAYIKASNAEFADRFASGIALDGDTIAVFAAKEDSNQTTITNGTGSSSNNSRPDAGAVYVYKRTGSSWAQEAYIKAANNDAEDYFGNSRYSAIDGDTLAIGATGEDSNQNVITNGTSASSNNSNENSGAVYVYKRTGTTWAQEAYIKPSNSDAGDGFGGSISISGNLMAVGATGEDSNQVTITNGSTASSNNDTSNSGAVYIFERTGTSWAQVAYIKAPNSDVNDYFGRSVSLDNKTLLVTSRDDSNQTTITNGTTASSDNSNTDSGAAYVFVLQ